MLQQQQQLLLLLVLQKKTLLHKTITNNKTTTFPQHECKSNTQTVVKQSTVAWLTVTMFLSNLFSLQLILQLTTFWPQKRGEKLWKFCVKNTCTQTHTTNVEDKQVYTKATRFTLSLFTKATRLSWESYFTHSDKQTTATKVNWARNLIVASVNCVCFYTHSLQNSRWLIKLHVPLFCYSCYYRCCCCCFHLTTFTNQHLQQL